MKQSLSTEHENLERVDISASLLHIDSDWCWCDPVIELDEAGFWRTIHKEVTWN